MKLFFSQVCALLLGLLVFTANIAFAKSVSMAKFSKVDDDISAYDVHVAKLNEEFKKIPANKSDNLWVRKKLAHMVEVDQYMRNYFMNIPHEHSYSEEEKKEFLEKFVPRFQSIDKANTTDLKELLRLYRWFTISEFGAESDNNAWLLVQHADLDPVFQDAVLQILSELWPKKETSARNYAYLFDRVAASWNDQSRRKLQRYGTQGICMAKNIWEPIPVEDPTNLDYRRASVGLGPEEEYIKTVSVYCK